MQSFSLSFSKYRTEEFGVEINAVQEIIRMVNITEIPRSPPYVRGLVNLRGHIVVVISLSTIMRSEQGT